MLRCSTALLSGIAVLAISNVVGGQTEPGRENAPKRPAKPSLRAPDLLDRVQVIGALGRPLGASIVIRGRWQFVAYKDTDRVLRVTHVDGKPLDSPVELRHVAPFAQGGAEGTTKTGGLWEWRVGGQENPPAPADGELWELQGIEDGHFNFGYDDRFWAELGGPTFATEAVGYLPHFTFIAVRRGAAAK